MRQNSTQYNRILDETIWILFFFLHTLIPTSGFRVHWHDIITCLCLIILDATCKDADSFWCHSLRRDFSPSPRPLSPFFLTAYWVQRPNHPSGDGVVETLVLDTATIVGSAVKEEAVKPSKAEEVSPFVCDVSWVDLAAASATIVDGTGIRL